MGSLTNVVVSLLIKYSLCFLALVIILQGIGVPTFPSLSVIASGAFSYAGEFNPVLLFFEVWILVMLGDTAGYFFWKRFGEFLFGKFKGLNKFFGPKLKKANEYLDSKGRIAVFLTRFLITPLAAVVNIVAGLSGYSYFAFISAAFVGDMLWTIIYISLGYWFGDSWQQIANLASQFGQLATLIVLLASSIYFGRRLIFKKRAKRKQNN